MKDQNLKQNSNKPVGIAEEAHLAVCASIPKAPSQ